LLLRNHTQGIIVDCHELTSCTAEGAMTFRDAMDYIERYHARIVVSRIPDHVMEVLRSVPGVRSRLPISDTLEEARASLRLTGAALVRQAYTPDLTTMLACRLAGADGRKARIHLAYILEVPRQLPLNAPLPEAESAAEKTLASAEKWVRADGLLPVTHVARTRDAGEEIVHQAVLLHANVIVLNCGVSGEACQEFMNRVARPVLNHAPCEVILNKLPLQDS
jgi:hypothetical protein